MKKPDRDYRALRELRRVVFAAPTHLLDMRWREHETACGTAHCAGGWATQDEWFQDRGLKLENGDFTLNGKTFGNDFVALSKCFRLTRLQTDRLFGSELKPHCHNKVPKQEVLDNIDLLIAGKSAKEYTSITHTY